MSEFIGPALPEENVPEKSDGEELIGPSLPGATCSETSVQQGPELPPHLKATQDDKANEEKDDLFGPALPPHLKKMSKSSGPIVGPQRPQEASLQASDGEDTSDDDDFIGPSLPPSDTSIDSQKQIVMDFENRSKQMKDKLTGKSQPKKLEREEWMTELPPVLKGFGMGPRQFRTNPTNVGDRSVWTDTPSDKLKKTSQKKSEPEASIDPAGKYVHDRDAEITKQLENYEMNSETHDFTQPLNLCSDLVKAPKPEVKIRDLTNPIVCQSYPTVYPGNWDSSRKDSLLSMHEKSRKRKLKEEKAAGKANIRRPFDRDVDLQANRFDDAAKKRMLKQSQGLNSRFSHGTTSSTFL